MHRSTRFYIRLLSAFFKKYFFLLFLGVFLGAFAFFVIPRIISLLPQIRSTQRIAYIGRYTLGTLPLSIQQQISIGLTSLNDFGRAAPAIATSWVATDSGKTYIFTLAPGLRWQDGTPLVSQDIKYNFSDATVTYPDSGHLVIELPDSFSPLPTIVSTPVFKVVKRGGLFPSISYYGLGAYAITGYRTNGPYLDSLTLSPTRADNHLPKIQYLFYPSPSMAITAFKLGEVSRVTGLEDLDGIKNWPNTTLTPHVLTDRYVAVFFNLNDPSFTGASGKDLRLALDYATDKSHYENRVYGPIAVSSWAYNPNIRHYDQDLTKARSFLKQVEKVPAKITLTAVSAYLDTATRIQSDWEQLGIQVDLQIVPDLPGSFQALVAAQYVPPDPDQYNYWHSTKDTNLTGIKNPRVDKKLEDGRKTLDPAERQALYADFQTTLTDEIPAIFLYNPLDYTLSRN